MPKPQYGYKHQQDRISALATFRNGDRCWRCGRPMFIWQALDLDHVRPVVRGGTDGVKRLTHAKCNRRSGAVLGNRSAKRKRNGVRVVRRELPKW